MAKRILELHSWRWVAAIFVGALVLWVALRTVVMGWNDRLEMLDAPGRPYAESVQVEPGSSLFFTWGVTANPRTKTIGQENLSEEERFGDTYTQAHAVLTQLTSDLREVGLTLRDVVNVRAYIVGNEEEPPDFEGWNRAFMEYFGTPTNPHKPARTSIGISRLFLAQYKIEVEFVAAFPDGRGPFVEGSKPYRAYDRINRVETSEAWKSYGRPRFPMSTGKALRGGDPLYFSSMVLPEPMNPMMAPKYWMFGPISSQATTIFKQTTAQLKAAGMKYENLFFVRTIMFPEKGKGIGGNFGVFNREYSKHLNNTRNPNRPTRTIMSAPGYTYRKQLLAIEMYGLYDDPETVDFDGRALKAFRAGNSLGSDGVAVSGAAQLEFFSGLISTSPKASLEAEGEEIFELLDERLKGRDLDFSNIVHLRVYVVAGTHPGAAVEEWEQFYETKLGSADQRHRPALTIMPIVSLPGDRKLEVEVLTASLPQD